MAQIQRELGMDRVTLVRRLEGIAPEKGPRNASLYRIRDVFSACLAHAESKKEVKVEAFTPEQRAEKEAQILETKLQSALVQLESDQIDLAKKKGDLLEFERVAFRWADLCASFRQRLLTLPSRLSLETQGLDRRDVERRADELVIEALNELAKEDDEGSDDPDSQ